jgi:hypothetical protein
MLVLVFALIGCGAPEAVVLAPPVAPAAAWTSFGAPATLAASAPVTAVLTDPAAHVDQVVRVEGRVSNVCAKAGCWLVLADDQGHQVRVTMKDHAFSVPKDCSGRTADIEGTLVELVTDPARVEHFESEQAGTAAPEKGTERHFEIVATGVRLQQG